MADKNQTYTLKFKANAEGLDEIIKKLSKIASGDGINLTKGMAEDLNKLQARMQVFIKAFNEEMAKEDPNPLNLKTLNKEFEQITDSAKKFGLSLSALQLPPDLQNQLTKVTDQLKEAQKQLTSAKRKEALAAGKINEKSTDTGLSSAGEAQAFNKVKAGKLDSGSDLIFTNAQQIKNVKKELEDLNATLDETSDQYKQNQERIAAYEQKLKEYYEACQDIVRINKERIAQAQKEQQAAKTAVDSYQQQIKELESKIAVSGSETEVSKQTVEALTELTNIRSAQADALFEEQDRISKEAQAERDAAQAAKQAAKEQEARAKATERAKEALLKNTDATDKNNKSTSKNTNLVAKATKQVFTYGTIMSLLRRIYRETITTITEMDKALTGMAVVTSMSREQTWELIGSFQELASQTGKTTSEIASMATKFYQQGKSTQQVLQLTEAAAKAATIAGISGSQSIDLLTNAMNGFQMSASQAMTVSDKFAALAASAATSYEELATALSKVAAQANLAGMSMDFTLGMLTKGIEVTREAPETIGTALKTVISRMRELTDYGTTLEDNMDVNRVEKALGNIGVELRDTNGEFRDLESVLTEVGSKWDTLNKNQQANVAVALAGTRQQSRLIAMMQDFDRTLELVDTSANSYGATMAQSAKYMEGLEAKMTLLTNSYQNLITNLVQSDFIIDIIDKITNLIGFTDSLLQNTAAMVPIITAIAVALIGVVASKLREAQIQKEINQLKEKEKALVRQKRILVLQETKDKRAQQIIDKKAKIVANENLLTEKAKTLEIEKQNILNNDALSEEEKTIQINQLEAQYALEANEINKQILEDKTELLNLEFEDTELKKLQTQEEQYQNNLIGQQGGLFGSVLSKLGLIQGVMVAINAAQKIWNTLKAAGNVLQEKGLKGAIQDGAQRLKNALFGSAESASQIPVVGWVIALSLLAAAGVAIAGVAIANAVQADKAAKSTEGTVDNLNKLQAELYNLNQSVTTVSKLGDEFDELNSKIIKTTEDLERMNEIAQSVNDEAGYEVVNLSASADTQAAQIAGYESMLRKSKSAKIDDIQSSLEAGFDSQQKVQGLNEQQYFEQLGAAGESALRSIATERLSYLSGLDSATQEIVKQAFVSAAPEMLRAGNGQLDMTMFTKDVAAISEQLNDTVTNGSLAGYKEMLQSLPEDLQNIFKQSNTTFAAVANLTDEAIQAFDDLKLSTDDVNTVMALTQKIAENGGKSFEQLLNDAKAAAEATGDLNKELYAQMVAEQEAAVARAQQWEETGREADEAAIKVQQAAVEAKQAQYDNQKTDTAAQKRKKEELEKELQTMTAELGEMTKKYEENSNAADIAKDNIAQLNNVFLVDNAIQDYTDSLTKIGSTLTRIGKVSDLTSLSIADQMDLLGDYPELLEDMRKGSLTAASALKVLNADFKEQRELLAQDIKDINTQWSNGTSTDQEILRRAQNALGTTLFTADSMEQMRALSQQDVDDFVEQMLSQGIGKEDAARLHGAIQDYVQKSYLAEQMDAEGISISLNVEIDRDKNSVAYSRATAQLDAYKTALSRVAEGTAEYNELLAQETEIQKEQIGNIDKLIDSDESQLRAMFGDIDSEAGEGSMQKIRDAFSIINGEVSLNVELYEAMTDSQKAALLSQWENLQNYAKKQQELQDEQYELYEAIAQKQIDAEKKRTEAAIEELEKRKEAYEKYFDELDALEEEEERAQSRDSLINQIAALTGALDSSGKSKIKELKAQLAELEKEELQAQKERQRDALLTAMDDNIEKLNEYLDSLDDTIYELIKELQKNRDYVEQYGDPVDSIVRYPMDPPTDDTKNNTPDTPTTPDYFATEAQQNTPTYDTQVDSQTGDITNNTSVAIGNIMITTDKLNNNQDWAQAGNTLANEFAKALASRGINPNVKK